MEDQTKICALEYVMPVFNKFMGILNVSLILLKVDMLVLSVKEGYGGSSSDICSM